MRLLATLLTASTLIGCGGGGGGTSVEPPPTPVAIPSFSIGGSISGLGNANGFTLTNGAETLVIAANAMNFTFANKVTQGSPYSVTIGNPPMGASCTVSNASGTVGLADIRSIAVTCEPTRHADQYRVSTFAGYDGQGTATGLINATGATARFNTPYGVATDAAGNVYVADSGNHAIRKIHPMGAVTTLAGGTAAVGDGVDGVGAAATFYSPGHITADQAGTVYVIDGKWLRRVTALGVVTTMAQVGWAQGIAVDRDGALYVSSSHSILKMTPGGGLTTLAGSQGSPGFVDGVGAAARFDSPRGLSVAPDGNVYVTDYWNHAVRKVSPLGQVTTLAHSPISTYSDYYFRYPNGVASDSAGNVYVAWTVSTSFSNSGYHYGFSGVRKIDSERVVTDVVTGNTTTFGYANGLGTAARFNNVQGIAIDGAGNLFIADTDNHAIRKITR
nr:hypothetical protein [uncultured Rhodoferax sp.]